MFAVAAWEYKTWKCLQYIIGLAYFGVMELLQAVQHRWLAVPEDGYAMCKDPTNQMLTFLGFLHIAFQPFFSNMVFMAVFRRTNLRDRIESELIQRICVFLGMWLLSSYFLAIFYPDNPHLAPPSTEECPNYEWMREGYDPYMNYTTPNVPGHSCTYKSPSENGHLAWVVPLYQATYFWPSASSHFLLLFVPYLTMIRRPLLMVCSLILFVRGPFAAVQRTPAINEQAATWCFFSVSQCIGLVLIYRWKGVHYLTAPDRIEEPGKLGEEPLVYVRLDAVADSSESGASISSTSRNSSFNSSSDCKDGKAVLTNQPMVVSKNVTKKMN